VSQGLATLEAPLRLKTVITYTAIVFWLTDFEARSFPYVRVLLDVEEIEQLCEEQGIPNDN
jgi:hypothetical protein